MAKLKLNVMHFKITMAVVYNLFFTFGCTSRNHSPSHFSSISFYNSSNLHPIQIKYLSTPIEEFKMSIIRPNSGSSLFPYDVFLIKNPLKITWSSENKIYSKDILIAYPIKDLDKLTGLTFYFLNDDCSLTYDYRFGEDEESVWIQVDQNGNMTEKSRLVVAASIYFDPRTGEKLKKIIASKENRKTQE